MTQEQKALEIYKPPFHISEPFIFSSNGVMAFTILTGDNELIWKILNALNEEDAHLDLDGITCKDDVFILKDGKNILMVRGWGHLTGCGALKLPDKEAIVIQDAFRDWVLGKISRKEKSEA